MRTVSFTVAALLFLAPLTAHAQWSCQGNGNVANCPPCFHNQAPAIPTKGGQWWDTAGNTGHVVNVFVQNSPGAVYSHAVDTGRAKWNNARDTTSTPGVTKRAPYEFWNTTNAADADVVVVFDSNFPGTAQYQGGHNPPRIVINPRLSQLDRAEFSRRRGPRTGAQPGPRERL